MSGCAFPDFEQAKSAVWRRLYSGAKSRAASDLPLYLKLRDVARVCWPSISYRCSWWPLGESLLSDIGILQKQVVASLIKLPKESWETPEAYCMRRGREAARHIDRSNCWMLKACSRVQSWDAHVIRGHFWSWAVEARPCRDSVWLQSRRLFNRSKSAFAGLLLSRARRGRPRVRWEEGLAHAAAFKAKQLCS